MMKISQPKLQAVCSIISALVPECRLMITDQGWNTMAVDTANVAMVSLNLPKGGFEKYDEKDKIEIGMDLEKWTGLFKFMDDKDSMIEIEREKDGRLRISDGRYTYKLTPLDPNTVRKRPTPPNLSLPASTDIDAADFQEAIKAMTVIADKAYFKVIKEGLQVSAEGDSDHLEKLLDTRHPPEFKGESVRSLFSLDYMKEIAKAMKGAGDVTVHVGQDHPIRFDCEVEGAEVSYMVAPRLEDK